MQTVYIDSAAELHDLVAVNIIARQDDRVDTETTGLDPYLLGALGAARSA